MGDCARHLRSDAPSCQGRRRVGLHGGHAGDDAEGELRAGRHRSRGARAGRRWPCVHLRNQVAARTYCSRTRSDHEGEQGSSFVPGYLWSGGCRRRAAAGRIRAGRRQRETGVEPVRAAHHRTEVRLRPRQPVREGPYQPGHLGLRRGGRRRRRHLQPRPELRPADSRPEPAQRAPDLRAGAERRRLRGRAGRRLRRGAVGRGNGAVGPGRQGAERAGVSAARREVPRQDPRLPATRRSIRRGCPRRSSSPRRRRRPSRTAIPRSSSTWIRPPIPTSTISSTGRRARRKCSAWSIS